MISLIHHEKARAGHYLLSTGFSLIISSGREIAAQHIPALQVALATVFEVQWTGGYARVS